MLLWGLLRGSDSCFVVVVVQLAVQMLALAHNSLRFFVISIMPHVVKNNHIFVTFPQNNGGKVPVCVRTSLNCKNTPAVNVVQLKQAENSLCVQSDRHTWWFPYIPLPQLIKSHPLHIEFEYFWPFTIRISIRYYTNKSCRNSARIPSNREQSITCHWLKCLVISEKRFWIFVHKMNWWFIIISML